jgi:hypothetical protein
VFTGWRRKGENRSVLHPWDHGDFSEFKSPEKSQEAKISEIVTIEKNMERRLGKMVK